MITSIKYTKQFYAFKKKMNAETKYNMEWERKKKEKEKESLLSQYLNHRYVYLELKVNNLI
jgi:hypothetical protein